MGKYIGKNGLKRIYRKTATATSNGMMSKEDKKKLNILNVLEDRKLGFTLSMKPLTSAWLTMASALTSHR